MDNQSYLPVIAELISEGQQVTLPVTGSSMNPFLAGGRDHVLLKAPDGELKRGDIVFYRRMNGDFILHRLIRTDGNGGLYFIGDSQTGIGGPVSKEQVIGKAAEVCRKGKWTGPGDFRWDFFAKTWLTLRPLRPAICRAYGAVHFWKGWKKHD